MLTIAFLLLTRRLCCWLSIQVFLLPEKPVVSNKTGHVFERSTILAHIQTTGRCPHTNIELSEKDIISLQVPSISKAKSGNNSIPEMIHQFQEEWDAVALETFSLKKHIENLREQLSHALYQHDAACRVIARLLREKEELLEAMQNLKLN